jgi:hypothetical protein
MYSCRGVCGTQATPSRDRVSHHVPGPRESCAKDHVRLAGISFDRCSAAVVARGRRGGHPTPAPDAQDRPRAPSHSCHPAAPRPRAVASSVSLNIDELRNKWQHVAVCEVSGNWSMVGPSYSGIGFSNGTWSQYGGRRFAPVAGDASRDQQIIIGMRVVHGQIPDQHGCSPYGW